MSKSVQVVVFSVMALVTFVALSTFLYFGATEQQKRSRLSFTYDSIALPSGQPRSYKYYAPDSPDKMLIVLHGGGGSFDQIDGTTNLSNKLKPEDKTILIYPNAIDKNWNDFRTNDGNPLSSSSDNEFIAELTNTFRKKYNVTNTNVFYAGISNGAIFLHQFLCDRNDFGGFLSIVGSFPVTPLELQCSHQGNAEIVLFHGTADKLIPYNGGKVAGGKRGEVESAEKTVGRWTNALKCTVEVEERSQNIKPDGTKLVTKDYRCEQGLVTHYIIENGGHNWPDEENNRIINFTGAVSLEVDATEVLLGMMKGK